MSTKIYNGYEIVGHTLESFLVALRTLRPQLEGLARRGAARFLANALTRGFDCEAFGLGARKNSAFFNARLALMDRQGLVERTRERDPQVDFSFEVVVLPAEDTLLALLFTEQADMRRLWQAQPWCREFGYWNNTDRPENINEEQWGERARLWQAALGDWYTPPAQAGYSFTMLPVDGHVALDIRIEDVLPHVPSVEQRAREVALAQLLAKAKEASGKISLSEVIALSNSPEHNALARELEPRIVAPLTAEQLGGST